MLEKLLARKAELEKEINEAPSWGASVGARYEELQEVLRSLRSLGHSDETPKKSRRKKDKPEPTPVESDVVEDSEQLEVSADT